VVALVAAAELMLVIVVVMVGVGAQIYKSTPTV